MYRSRVIYVRRIQKTNKQNGNDSNDYQFGVLVIRGTFPTLLGPVQDVSGSPSSTIRTRLSVDSSGFTRGPTPQGLCGGGN